MKPHQIIVKGVLVLLFFPFESTDRSECKSSPTVFVMVTLFSDVSVTELPYNDYFEYFGPDFKLHISPSNMTNQNTQEYLDKIKYVEEVNVAGELLPVLKYFYPGEVSLAALCCGTVVKL